MQEYVKSVGLVILCLFILVILRQAKGEMHIPVRLVVAVVLFCVFMGVADALLEEFFDALQIGGIKEYAAVMLKALAVGIITGLCSNMCADAGEGTLSYVCVLLGKAQMLIISLPLIKEIIETAVKFIDGADV